MSLAFSSLAAPSTPRWSSSWQIADKARSLPISLNLEPPSRTPHRPRQARPQPPLPSLRSLALRTRTTLWSPRSLQSHTSRSLTPQLSATSARLPLPTRPLLAPLPSLRLSHRLRTSMTSLRLSSKAACGTRRWSSSCATRRATCPRALLKLRELAKLLTPRPLLPSTMRTLPAFHQPLAWTTWSGWSRELLKERQGRNSWAEIAAAREE